MASPDWRSPRGFIPSRHPTTRRRCRRSLPNERTPTPPTRMAAALSSRVTLRAAPVVRGAKASKAAATTRPTRSLATRAAIADLPKENKDTKVLVVGGTGYIGKFVVRELCAQGYDVTAFVREKSGIGGKTDAGARRCSRRHRQVWAVGSVDSIRRRLRLRLRRRRRASRRAPAASRTAGTSTTRPPRTSSTSRGEGRQALRPPLRHLRAEAAADVPGGEAQVRGGAPIRAGHQLLHRPPHRVLQVLAGQVESVQKGGPYVMFGDGQLASCKPISERDLAKYMAECIRDASLENKVLPIGGPGKAMSALEQGTMLFDILGMEPKFVKVPIEVMDGVIKILDTFAGFFANMRDAAEFGKIGRYYAAESMLVLDEETKYDAAATPSSAPTPQGFLQEGVGGGSRGAGARRRTSSRRRTEHRRDERDRDETDKEARFDRVPICEEWEESRRGVFPRRRNRRFFLDIGRRPSTSSDTVTRPSRPSRRSPSVPSRTTVCVRPPPALSLATAAAFPLVAQRLVRSSSPLAIRSPPLCEIETRSRRRLAPAPRGSAKSSSPANTPRDVVCNTSASASGRAAAARARLSASKQNACVATAGVAFSSSVGSATGPTSGCAQVAAHKRRAWERRRRGGRRTRR